MHDTGIILSSFCQFFDLYKISHNVRNFERNDFKQIRSLETEDLTKTLWRLDGRLRLNPTKTLKTSTIGRDWNILNHQCHQLNVRGCDGIYIVGSHEIEIQGFLRFQGVQVSAQSLNWRCSRQTGLFWDPMELILAKNVYDMRHIGISYATKLPRIAAFFM